MTFLICSGSLACAKNWKNEYRFTYAILVCLECWDDVFDGPLNEHTPDKTKAFSIRLLGKYFVKCS